MTLAAVRSFTLEYFDLLARHFDASTDSQSLHSRSCTVHWSLARCDAFASRCRELFFYSLPSLLEDYAYEANSGRSIVGLHYGPIGATSASVPNEDPGTAEPRETAVQVATKGLLMGDAVVFQDLVHRLVSRRSDSALPLEAQRNQHCHIIAETISLRPFVESGRVLYIPWLPQWGSDFRASVHALGETIAADEQARLLVANVIAGAKALGASPFTTFAPASECFLKHASNLMPDTVHRLFHISNHLLDHEFSYLEGASPQDVIEVSEAYRDFRARLREHFASLMSIDHQQFERRLRDVTVMLAADVERTREQIQRRSMGSAGSLVAAGIGSAVALLGVASGDLLLKTIGGAGLAKGLLGGIKDLWKWASDRIADTSSRNILCCALLDIEKKLDRSH